MRNIILLRIIIGVLLISSCVKGELRHDRYIQNNTANDTIIVINPDFDDSYDTIIPGDRALIYSFEILDTDQEYESCKWQGDTLIVKNQNGDALKRTLKIDEFWTYTLQGDNQRIQTCTFIVSTGDF